MMNCADLRSPFIAWLRMLVAMASFLVMGVPSGLVAMEPSLRMTGSESCDSKYSSIVICSCVLFCFAMLCCISIIPSKSRRGLLSGMCIFCTDHKKAEGFPNSSAPNQIINIFDNHEKRIFTFTLTGFLSAWEVISRPCLYHHAKRPLSPKRSGILVAGRLAPSLALDSAYLSILL